MTVREIYEHVLIELHKINAPNLKLFEFNYYCNKAINQVVNKIYNLYDTSQQTSDDLRVLQAQMKAEKTDSIQLPEDYLHLLNCICTFTNSNKCHNKYSILPATKITSDQLAQVMQNAYNKPSYKKPYYQVNNDRIDIIYGNDSTFELDTITIDYLKKPQLINLTLNEVEQTLDNSQTMEFPDYINQEIVNELVQLVMERTNDPRLATNIQMTQSIARPTQQQATT